VAERPLLSFHIVLYVRVEDFVSGTKNRLGKGDGHICLLDHVARNDWNQWQRREN